MSAYPWAALPLAEVSRAFHSESWAGKMALPEFQRMLDFLGLDGRALAKRLFKCFDCNGDAGLDFREVFIGMALLCAGSNAERMEHMFKMMDANGSGRVSREEMVLFLQTVAPSSASRQEIGMLALQIIHEADVNKSGLITFAEFNRWKGKHQVLDWLDAYHDRVLFTYSEGDADLGQYGPNTSVPSNAPWAKMTTKDVLRVFRAEPWSGKFSPQEFERVLLRLGAYWAEDRVIVQKLFDCFDQDGSGLLDYREAFIGLTLLCSTSRQDRLQCMFTIMDTNGSGHVSREELATFLHFLWPPGVDSMHDCRITLRCSRIMLEADQNQSGLITFDEYMAWNGKELELKMMDARLSAILSCL